MVELDAATATQRASFATTARLFSCLVTEGLIRALYIPLESSGDTSNATGICIAFDGTTSDCGLLAVIPLRHTPVFKHGVAPDVRGKEIGLLDPMDMVSLVYHVHQTEVANGNAVPEDPVRSHYYLPLPSDPLTSPYSLFNPGHSMHT